MTDLIRSHKAVDDTSSDVDKEVSRAADESASTAISNEEVEEEVDAGGEVKNDTDTELAKE